MALQVQACSSFQKQRCKADTAKRRRGVSAASDASFLWSERLSVPSLTRSAKLNGKVVAAIFPK